MYSHTLTENAYKLYPLELYAFVGPIKCLLHPYDFPITQIVSLQCSST